MGDTHLQRPELTVYEGQKFDYYNREPWCRGRSTLVFVGDAAHMPCGLFAVRAYSPTGVAWERRWREDKPSQLVGRFGAIAKELEAAVPHIIELQEEAKKRAEAERQRWEAAWREHERQERERRRAEALKESREQFLRIVEAWSLARDIEGFFEDAERRATTWSQVIVLAYRIA